MFDNLFRCLLRRFLVYEIVEGKQALNDCCSVENKICCYILCDS